MKDWTRKKQLSRTKEIIDANQYLSLSQLARCGVMPKLKEWQAFVIICLVASFAFVIALLAIRSHSGPIENSIP